MMERRQFGRRELAIAGSIEPPLRPPIACEVRNLSREGALLTFDSREYLPGRFHLRFDDFQTPCQVIHRDRGLAGVVFEIPYTADRNEAAEPDAPPAPQPGFFSLQGLMTLFTRRSQ